MAIVSADGVLSSSVQDYQNRIAGDIARGIGRDTDFEPETPQAQMAGAIGASLAQVDQGVSGVYDAIDIHTSAGSNLDHLIAWIGEYRRAAARSTVTVTFTGTSGAVIPAGTRVRSTNDDFFATDTAITLSGTTGDVAVTAAETGPVPVAAGTLTGLASTIAGVSAVTNAAAGVQGRSVETDTQFRNRYFDALSQNAIGSAGSLQAAVLAVDGVTYCVVRDNATDASVMVQGVGIAAHSFVAVVEGGTDLAVATAISGSKPMGIAPSGTTSQSVQTLGGFSENISFERVQTIAVKFTIVARSTIDFPGDGSSLIKNALLDFVGDLLPGEPIDTDRSRAAILNAVGDFSITTFTITDTSDAALPDPVPLNRRLTLALADIDLTIN